MTPRQHLAAGAALVAISTNLTLWCIPLLGLLILRTLVPGARPGARAAAEGIYRLAVTFDDWWLKRVSGAAWQDPGLALDRNRACIVVANHRSWADVFLIQSALARRGPVVKFLCKRELAWIPILGLIFVVFDFPVVRRRAASGPITGATTDAMTEAQRRAADRRRVHDACQTLRSRPAAMLSFVEGTRFTRAKHARAGSPYRALLPPRAGGFEAIVQALAPDDAPVVDLTLVYPDRCGFWAFLGGAAGAISVHAERLTMREVLDAGPRDWLEARWRRKDEVLLRK